METLIRAYSVLLNNTTTDFVRYLHDQVLWDSRLIAILGARGVGKKTLLLQQADGSASVYACKPPYISFKKTHAIRENGIYLQLYSKQQPMALQIIHTADWHLGQTFFGYDREVEHDAFLTWLAGKLVERQTDVLLIAGDVFDTANPSAAAQRRFYHFLKEANRTNPRLQIVIIAGNHDSAIRLEAPNPLLEELNTTIVGVIKRRIDGTIDPDSLVIPLKGKDGKRAAWCLAVPFLRQGDYPASAELHDTYIAGVDRMYKWLYAYAESKREPGEAIIALGHLHATGSELSEDDRSERIIMGGLESVPVDTFDPGLAYTALGHIHKAQRVGGRETVRYAGSPLPMSFSEKKYRHQVVSIEIQEDGACAIEALPIPLFAELRRIPESPLLPDEVLALLSELPISDTDDKERWPYLEVRVLLTEPDPSFRHRVEEALEGKAVRLTAIVPSYPKREAGEAEKALSYADLQKISPLDMLRHAFTSKYGGDLPIEIEDLFNEVTREVTV